jgi:hypothetical protein
MQKREKEKADRVERKEALRDVTVDSPHPVELSSLALVKDRSDKGGYNNSRIWV